MSSAGESSGNGRGYVDTRKCVRREVHYDSADEVVADAERLVAMQAATTGNWSLGEIIDHLATGIELVLDGFDHRAVVHAAGGARLFPSADLDARISGGVAVQGGERARGFSGRDRSAGGA